VKPDKKVYCSDCKHHVHNGSMHECHNEWFVKRGNAQEIGSAPISLVVVFGNCLELNKNNDCRGFESIQHIGGDNMKFCKDCKRLTYKYPHNWYFHADESPKHTSYLHECRVTVQGFEKYDLVTGDVIYSKAKDMREVGGLCGPEGKLWEPKNKT